MHNHSNVGPIICSLFLRHFHNFVNGWYSLSLSLLVMIYLSKTTIYGVVGKMFYLYFCGKYFFILLKKKTWETPLSELWTYNVFEGYCLNCEFITINIFQKSQAIIFYGLILVPSQMQTCSMKYSQTFKFAVPASKDLKHLSIIMLTTCILIHIFYNNLNS